MKDREPKTRNHANAWLHSPLQATASATAIATQVVLAIMIAGIVLAVACSAETPPVSSKPPEPLPISGLYEVSGLTVDLESGEQREISGKVTLKQEGTAYTATFDLDTLFPTQQGNLEAVVIGQGAGSIDGRTLTGNAETQIVISKVPGIDPGFAFIPRTTTKRIVSTSVSIVQADGTVSIEIESSPAEGETYSRTRTTLRGKRVSGLAIGGGQQTKDSPHFGEPAD